MKPYKSKSGKDSGVTSYQIGDTYIRVSFHGTIYKYSYGTAGKVAIEKMKQLAEQQEGLSTYISQFKPPYEV